jgi:hypothetical protein
MDDVFARLEDDDELGWGLWLTELEHGMLTRGRMIDDEVRQLGHRLDPLTFVLTDWHDLCQHLGLDDDQSTALTSRFSEYGGLGRVLQELQLLVGEPLSGRAKRPEA